jgi:hypothetical protein
MSLVPFWIVPGLPHGPLGFGVTAADLEDTFSHIVAGGYVQYLREGRASLSVKANVTFDELPRHVQWHLGPMVVRGVWYPWPTPAWFARE